VTETLWNYFAREQIQLDDLALSINLTLESLSCNWFLTVNLTKI